jgi:hypothetical protein
VNSQLVSQAQGMIALASSLASSDIAHIMCLEIAACFALAMTLSMGSYAFSSIGIIW